LRINPYRDDDFAGRLLIVPSTFDGRELGGLFVLDVSPFSDPETTGPASANAARKKAHS